MSNRLHLVLSYKMRGTLPPKTSIPLFAIHALVPLSPELELTAACIC